MPTYQELLAQKAALEQQAALLSRQIEDARRTERAAVIDRIKALMAEHGVTLVELGGGARKSGSSSKSAATKTARKVAAKYRDPSSGNSWSGRGLQPNWLKAALAAGRKLEDFAV